MREALSLDINGKFIVTQHTPLNPGREAIWQLYAIFDCRMTALNENIGLYQGPSKRQLLGTFGKFYDAGTLIGVVGQSEEGWWKLVTGEWIQRDLTTSDGTCDALPELTID